MKWFTEILLVKNYHYLILFICAFSISSCESQSLPGVYAGVGLELQVNFGGGMGMGRNDITLYLRPDGTFTNDLKSKTWETEIKGSYRSAGGKVILTYKSVDRKDTYTYQKGVLSDGATVLVKMDDNNKVPPGKYSFTYASGSGGGMSGSPYVGASGGKEFYFDGKGNFSKEGYGSVAIAGDNIGGGASHSDPSQRGTYSLHKGEMTLTYQNGETQKHSFFASDGETVTAIIDGQIFFMDKNKTTKLPTAVALAEAIKDKQGGLAIDEMKTLLIEGLINDIKIINKKNFTNNSSRLELYKDDKLILITQWDGSDGWEWNGKMKKPLTVDKAKDMKYNFFTGIVALKKSSIPLLSKGSVTREDEGYGLNYSVDNIDFKIITDKDYKIVGEYNTISGKPFNSHYRNYKTTSGILFPYSEEDETDGQSYELKITKILVNDSAALNWKDPEV